MASVNQLHQVSLWEKEVFPHSFDVVIVGSGIVGLNAAISLAEEAPALKVAVVDQWYYPLGASTRNAGFATFGSLSELVSDIAERGWDACLELVRQRWEGLRMLKKRVEPAEMEFHVHGGHEIFRNEDMQLWELAAPMVDELNVHLREIVGEHGQFSVSESHGFKAHRAIKRIVSCPAEGYLHPGKLMKHLLQKAIDLKITLVRPFQVKDWRVEDTHIHVSSEQGMSLKCVHLVFATNGFTSRLLPELDVLPARNQVILTGKIPGLQWRGCFHSHAGFFYFRDYRGRILLGGARNHDPAGEETDAFGFTGPIQGALRQYLHEVVLPGANVKIERSWSGIMGVGKEKKPIVRNLGNRIYCAVRLGGMGVAIGSQVGADAADLVLQNA